MAKPHCPACSVVADLVEHRNKTAAEWSVRRGTLNFAIVVAMRSCPDYIPEKEKEHG